MKDMNAYLGEKYKDSERNKNKAGYTANTSCRQVGRGVFTLSNSIITDGPTDGWTDEPTDGQMEGQSLFYSCVSATKDSHFSRLHLLRGLIKYVDLTTGTNFLAYSWLNIIMEFLILTDTFL